MGGMAWVVDVWVMVEMAWPAERDWICYELPPEYRNGHGCS